MHHNDRKRKWNGFSKTFPYSLLEDWFEDWHIMDYLIDKGKI